MQKIRKAVIPAAGFGTRFLPETKAMPKEMLPIVDKPTIQYIVEEIKASGIEQILIISGHAKRAIEDHFDSSPELEQHLYESGKMDLLKEVRQVASVKIHYTRQQYMRGLGDAILCAKEFMDGEPKQAERSSAASSYVRSRYLPMALSTERQQKIPISSRLRI